MSDDKVSDGDPSPQRTKESESAQAEPLAIPPVVPPQTAAPIQFNQQVNLSIQQIPPSAWDRLSSDQIVEISKAIIAQADSADQRQFDYAMEEIRRSSAGKRTAIVCGSIVALLAYAASAYLGLRGQSFLAACIALPVTTVLAVIVGNRFLDNS